MYRSPKEVKERYKITSQTLYNWRKGGKISFKRLPSGSIVYLPLEKVKSERKNVVYARVSNTKHFQDLQRQISMISEYMTVNGIKIDHIYEDVASGMNENRKGFNDLLEEVVQGDIAKIFVSYKDRLSRFGFGYIEKFCSLHGTQIEVLNSTREEDFQTELTQDLVSIIHHFSMKLYSKHRSELKQLSKCIENEIV